MRIFLKRCVMLFGLLTIVITAMAQKPKWVDNTPEALNNTYKFVEVVSYATDIASAREEAKKKLASNEQLVRTVKINVETNKLRNLEQTVVNGQLSETLRDRVDVQMQVAGKQFSLQAYPVDEYVTSKNGLVELHTLFMVAVADNAMFDRTYLTTSYGFAPVAMSIIPGLGQWYKGSKVKGICMFAAEAAAVAGVIVCANKANSFVNKIKMQPKFAKQYESKKSNYETGRNICIGAAAAIWIYNIIDAAAAKGARRVKVKPADGGLSLMPCISDDCTGVSLCYSF